MEQQINGMKFRHDVLMLALARHDNAYSSTAWSLAKAFSEEGRVFFIDNPFTFSDFFKKEKKYQVRKRYTRFLTRKKDLLQLKGVSVQVVVPPLMVPVNWLPPGVFYHLISRFNNWNLRRVVNKILKKNQVKDYIYINSFNPFYGAKANFEPAPSFYFYQTVDDISQSKYIDKHGPALEQIAMRYANACVATSGNLKRMAALFSRKAHLIPNAVDVSLFKMAANSQLKRPDELIGEKRKIIGYTGSIDHRLDYTLLSSIARQHKDKLFLMIGPVVGPNCRKSGFYDLPNVLFTGKKQQKELPAYLQYVDCAIIPFKCNELTASIYPLKINEYLAAGKPVVSTPFSEDICSFEAVITLEANEMAFSKAIEEQIHTDNDAAREKRINLAVQNSWKSRAYSFYELALWGGKEDAEKSNNSAYEKPIG